MDELDRPYHAIASLFPLMQGAEFDELKADIAKNGLLEAIWLHPDQSIIDGRNRHRACIETGAQPRFRTWGGDGSLVSFVVSMNLHRRHLTYDQRIGMALKLEPAYAEEAAQRQAATQFKNGRAPVAPISEQPVVRAAVQAADQVNVGKTAVYEMKAATKQDPELPDKLISGQTTVKKERKKRKTKKRQEKRAAMAQAAQEIEPSERWQIFHADMRTWIAPRRYDFIICDPPYPREYLPLYEALARRSVDWLIPDGLLVVMCGQSYLDEIMAMMSQHLAYYWTAAYLTPGQPTPLRHRQVNTSWKPLLMFTLKGGTYKGKIFGDVYTSPGRDKDYHDWGQSVGGMLDVVNQICLPGQWILDPFSGACATGIAALGRGCLFHGVEIDEIDANASIKRLGDYDQAAE